MLQLARNPEQMLQGGGGLEAPVAGDLVAHRMHLLQLQNYSQQLQMQTGMLPASGSSKTQQQPHIILTPPSGSSGSSTTAATNPAAPHKLHPPMQLAPLFSGSRRGGGEGGEEEEEGKGFTFIESEVEVRSGKGGRSLEL